MVAFLLYLVKVSVCFVLFYLFYKAFFSNDTFFRFNRKILLTGTTVCILLPLIRLPVETLSIVQVPFVVIENSLNEIETPSVPVLEFAILRQEQTGAGTGIPFSVSLVSILCHLYFGGLFIHLILLLRSYVAMWRVFKDPDKTILHTNGYILIVLDWEIASFSWYKYIVISREDYKNHPEEILTHEIAHIRHCHSVDLILYELFILFQWFNPAIWLLSKELRNVHEYQADMSVLESGIDATRYQLLLVKKAVGSSSYTLANSFNHSKLKKRITMMLKEKSNQRARLKVVLFLPLGVIALQAFAHTLTKEKEVLSSSVITSEFVVNQDKGTTLISSSQKENVEFYHVFIVENKSIYGRPYTIARSTRLTPAEYEQFLTKATRNFSDEKEALRLNEKYATSHAYWKDRKEREEQFMIVGYHILSEEQMENFMKGSNIAPPPPPEPVQ